MSKKVCELPKTAVTGTTTTLSNFSKWVPLICAGAAVGVSILALKEIKNVRKELIIMKKESVQGPLQTVDTELSKKVEMMDEQLRKITEYLVKKKEPKQTKRENKPVLKDVKEPVDVNIINSSPEDEEVEYIEVTDDEEN